jgi:hypothetical protein
MSASNRAIALKVQADLKQVYDGGSVPKRRAMAERGRKMDKSTSRNGRKMCRSNIRTAMTIMAGARISVKTRRPST